MQKHKLMLLLIFMGICVSPTMAKPTITWTPSAVSETTITGGKSSQETTFTSQEPLSNVELKVSPELASFVTVSPSTISFVPANTPQVITLEFAVPLNSSARIFAGILAVTSGHGTIAQPLPIKLSTTELHSGPVPELLAGAVPPPASVPPTRLLQYNTRSGDVVSIEVIEGRINVLFDSGVSENASEKLITNQGGVVIGKIPRVGLYLVQVEVGNENSFIGALRTAPGVIYVEPDLPATPHLSRPNEWLSNSSLALNSWYLKSINAPMGWNVAGSSSLADIELGILDFGFRDLGQGASDLQGRLENGIPNGTIKHGTLVTALAAATGNNDFGNVGVNWSSKVRLTQTNGANAFFDLVSAAAAGSEVVNMSFGIGNNDAQCSVAEAATKPIYFNGLFATVGAITTSLRLFQPGHRFLVVNSAGNDNCVLTGIQIGPKPSNVLIAGATTFFDKKAAYSDHGPLVDLAAPGGDQTFPIFWIDYNSSQLTDLLDGSPIAGTSVSAPFVSGAAALVWAKEPRISAGLVARRLKETARRPLNYPNDLGTGILDVGIALAPTTAIRVDGDSGDWANISPLLVDPSGDGPFDIFNNYYPGLDIKNIYVTNDAFNVYFLFEFVSEPPIGGGLLTFLNTDLNVNTGCPVLFGSDLIMFFDPNVGPIAGERFDIFGLGDERDCSAGDDFPQAIRFARRGRFLEAAMSIDDVRILHPGTNSFEIWGEALAPGANSVVEFVFPPATYVIH